MAVERVLLTENRILLTKPGFAAVPGVADENKVFDSEWQFTGTLLARGRFLDTAVPVSGALNTTYETAPATLAIPLPFVVRDVFVQLIPGTFGAPNGLGRFNTMPQSLFTYSSGLLSLPRPEFKRANNDGVFSYDPPRYERFLFAYRIYSL